MEPVVAQPEDDYAIREEDIPKICEEYDKLAKEMIKREKEGRGFNFFHFMIDLTGGPCVYKRLSGCGSGTEYLAVTPWGDFYPCHQFVGNEKFLLGNVDTGIVQYGDSVTNSSAAMSMPRKNVRNALPDSIAAEAVLLIPITSMAPSTMPMTSAVSSSASEWSARL